MDPKTIDERLQSMANAQKEPMFKHFRCLEMAPELAAVAGQFAQLALFTGSLPKNPERTVALRKLLEGRDAALRAVT